MMKKSDIDKLRREKRDLLKKTYKELSLLMANKLERKDKICELMKRDGQYTIEDIRRMFYERNCPVSRVTINLYLRELQLEGKIEGMRRDLGGKLYFKKVNK